MKIIYVIKSMANVAGTERIISNKMNYLAANGYDVTLVTHEQGTHPLSFKLNENINIYDFNTRFFILHKYGIIERFLRFRKLKTRFKKEFENVVKTERPNIICCTTYSIRILDIIHNIAIKYNAKSIVESHVSMFSLLNTYENDKKDLFFHINTLIIKKELSRVRKFDELITLTQGDALAWSKYKQAKIIPNFVDSANTNTGINKITKKRIICVGRLERQKGFDLLIKAFSLINNNNWTLDIFGNGPEKEHLTNQIKALGLERFIYIHEPSLHIYKEYLNSDFLVLSSRYEGFGLVLAEAMTCGIPCVSFNCEYGPSEIINDGIDGLLAKDGDVKDLAEKIEWMISHDDDRKKMGLQAYEDSKVYTIEPIMKKWINLFNELNKKI